MFNTAILLSMLLYSGHINCYQTCSLLVVRTMRKSKGRSCWSTLGLVRNYAVGKTVAKPVNLSRFAVMKSAAAPVRSSVPNESLLTLALYVGL